MNPAFDIIGLTQLLNDTEFSSLDGSGFSVVIIDTGLDKNHDLLKANYRGGFDFLEDSEEVVDQDGHGTHVAGIIGSTDANIGVAPGVGLLPLRVFADNGNNVDTPLNDALNWVLEHQAEYKIIAVNISGGSGFYQSASETDDQYVLEKIRDLESQGITVVAAAGNNYRDDQEPGLASPAIYSTLAVGATWQDEGDNRIRWRTGAIDYSTDIDRIVSFSQRLQGDNFLFAPGAVITSTVPDNKIGTKAGTSMAAPMVTGTVALMQQAALEFGDRLLSPEEIRGILQATADTIFDGDDEDDNVENTGLAYPRLNVYRAVTEIKNRAEGRFNGSSGADLLRGTRGNDTIKGGLGNDTLIGGLGDDRLFSGPGDNLLVGEAGSDRFILTAPLTGFQRLRDFHPSSDLIVIYARDFALHLRSRTVLPEKLFKLGTPDPSNNQGFTYHPDSGRLWFESRAIASFQNTPSLTNNDILVI